MSEPPKSNSETLLKFPCDFTLKIFGKATAEFETAVSAIVQHHIKHNASPAITSRLSENGKYLALSVTVHVDSKSQLDKIYQELSAHPLVLMAI